MYLTQTSPTIGNQDHDWLGSAEGTQSQRSATLAIAAFTAETHYPSSYLLDGLPLARATSGTYSGKYVPLAARVNEIQTATIGGSGLTSFTLTFDGETTASIDAAATAATVDAALEALSSIDAGAIVVSGSAGGPYTITFSGTQFQGIGVPALTATPTGGSGTVTIATPTGGGSGVTDNSDVLVGFLYMPVAVPTGATNVIGSVLIHGVIDESELPIAVTAQQKATNTHFIYV
jgi:hypothetical protein